MSKILKIMIKAFAIKAIYSVNLSIFFQIMLENCYLCVTAMCQYFVFLLFFS